MPTNMGLNSVLIIYNKKKNMDFNSVLMNNYFTYKRITLITLLGFFLLENVIIPNYNECKLFTFTKQSEMVK